MNLWFKIKITFKYNADPVNIMAEKIETLLLLRMKSNKSQYFFLSSGQIKYFRIVKDFLI